MRIQQKSSRRLKDRPQRKLGYTFIIRKQWVLTFPKIRKKKNGFLIQVFKKKSGFPCQKQKSPFYYLKATWLYKKKKLRKREERKQKEIKCKYANTKKRERIHGECRGAGRQGKARSHPRPSHVQGFKGSSSRGEGMVLAESSSGHPTCCGLRGPTLVSYTSMDHARRAGRDQSSSVLLFLLGRAEKVAVVVTA